MDFMRAHSTFLFGVFCFVLFSLGAFLVYNKLGVRVSPQQQSGWMQNAPTFNPERTLVSEVLRGSGTTSISEEDLFTHLARADAKKYSVLTPQEKEYNILTPNAQSGTYEYKTPAEIEALLKTISPTASLGKAVVEEDIEYDLEDIYAFMPQGLINPSAPAKERTTLQRELRTYGNTIGASVESHYDNWGARQANVLRRAIEDPTNELKFAEGEELAQSYIDLAKEIEEVTPVPKIVEKTHIKLIAGYKKIGEKTFAVVRAKGGDSLLNAISASNAASDEFARTYIQLVEAFVMNGVIFTSMESGRMFSFSAL